jgi:hypothetical protein
MNHPGSNLPPLMCSATETPCVKMPPLNPIGKPMVPQTAVCPACVDRRAFLTALAGAVSAAGLMPFGTMGALAAAQTATGVKPRIRLVFSHHRDDARGKQSEAGWPFLGYDCAGKKKELLAKLQQSCPGIEFAPATAYSAEDAKKILEADKEVDGYLAYMIGGWAAAGQTIAAAGRPVIYAGDLYGASGEFLVAVAEARHKGLRAVGVTSSRFDDVVHALRCFETIKKLQAARILVVGAPAGPVGKAIEETFGTKVISIDFPGINAAFAQADRARARELARGWIRKAQRVVEPTHAEIEKSAAMYLAMRSLMDQYQAQAITINCLGGFYSGHMEAYPCLGHFQLNNDGSVGACEADLQSTLTMLLMGYLVRRPGYISDPVIDTATNRVVYLHCVAPTKVFGPEGSANPYHIRSHAEDQKGASIRSLLPLGHLTTTLQIAPVRREIIFHQAKTVANVDDPRSCRTKLAAEVKGDIEKLLTQWDLWGWHRVTFYGDHRLALSQMSALLGFKLIEEA